MDLLLIISIVYLLYWVSKKILYLWLLKRYGVKLKIGRCGFFCFSDIHLQLKDGLKLEIKEAGFSSRIFKSSFRRPIVLYIDDIKLQGDIDMFIGKTSKKKMSSEEKESTFSFMKYACILKNFSVHISSASLVQLGKSPEEFVFHLSFQDICLCFIPKLDGMHFTTFVESLRVKVFKHIPFDQVPGPCICRFSSNINLHFQLNKAKRVLFERPLVAFNDPKLMLYEDFSLAILNTYIQDVLQRKRQYANVLASVKEDDVPGSTSLKNRLEKLPKTCELVINSFTVEVKTSARHRTLLFTVERVKCTWHFEKEELTDFELPTVTTNILVKGISSAYDHNEIVKIEKLKFNSDVVKVIDARFDISGVHLLYNEEVLQYCLRMSLLNGQKAKQMSSTKTQRKNMLVELFNGYKLDVSALVANVCASFKLPGNKELRFGFLKCSSSLEHIIGDRRPDDNINTKNSVPRHLLFETVYFKFSYSVVSDGKKMEHYSNFLHIAELRIKATLNQSNNHVNCRFRDCEILFSPRLYIALIHFQRNVINNFLQYGLQKSENIPPSKYAELSTAEKKKTSLSILFTGLNLFALSEHNAGIKIATNIVNINSSELVKKVAINGLKLMSCTVLAQVSPCDSKINNCNLLLKDVSITYLEKLKEITVASGDVHLIWNTDLYERILRIAEEGLNFKESIQECLKSSLSACIPDVKSPDPITIYMIATGKIYIGGLSYKEHEICLSSAHVSLLSNSPNELNLSSNLITFRIDEMDICDFKEIEIFLFPGDKHHHPIEQGFNKLVQLSDNQFLLIHVGHFELTLVENDMFDECFDWFPLPDNPFVRNAVNGVERVVGDISSKILDYVLDAVFK